MINIRKKIEDNWLIFTLAITSVVFCYAFYREYNKNQEMQNCTHENDIVSTIEIQGSKSNIYVVEDTSTGMVWVGIPGVNLINKK